MLQITTLAAVSLTPARAAGRQLLVQILAPATTASADQLAHQLPAAAVWREFQATLGATLQLQPQEVATLRASLAALTTPAPHQGRRQL